MGQYVFESDGLGVIAAVSSSLLQLVKGYSHKKNKKR